MAENQKSGSATGGPPAQPMAPQPVAAQTGNVPAASHAAQSVPRFGGNRGGQARADGLPPGSPEAKEADKKKDRERKQADRKARAVAQPAPLPSADSNGASAMPATPGSPGPGVAAPVVAAAPVVPWTAEMLKPLTDELIAAAEEGRLK